MIFMAHLNISHPSKGVVFLSKPSFFGVPMLNFGGGRPYVLVLVEDRRYPGLSTMVSSGFNKKDFTAVEIFRIEDHRSEIYFHTFSESWDLKTGGTGDPRDLQETDSKPSKGGSNDSYGTYYNQWNCERNLHLSKKIPTGPTEGPQSISQILCPIHINFPYHPWGWHV